MGIGYEIGCNKCFFTRSLRVGVGMLHSSLEAEIESTSRKEQPHNHNDHANPPNNIASYPNFLTSFAGSTLV